MIRRFNPSRQLTPGGRGLSCWNSLTRRSCPRRSPKARAEQAELKSCKDDKITAQGQRGTSAALGMRHKMIRSLVSNRVWRAPGAPNPIGNKRDWVQGGVYPGRRPRRPCPGLLSGRPSRGSGGHLDDRRLGGFGRRWANHRLQARPGFSGLSVLRPWPGPPEFQRYAVLDQCLPGDWVAGDERGLQFWRARPGQPILAQEQQWTNHEPVEY